MAVSNEKKIGRSRLQDDSVVGILKDFTAAIRDVLTEVKESMLVLDKKIRNVSLEIQNTKVKPITF